MKDFLGQKLNAGDLVIYNGGVHAGCMDLCIILRLGSSNNLITNQGGYCSCLSAIKADHLIPHMSSVMQRRAETLRREYADKINHTPVEKKELAIRYHLVRLQPYRDPTGPETSPTWVLFSAPDWTQDRAERFNQIRIEFNLTASCSMKAVKWSPGDKEGREGRWWCDYGNDSSLTKAKIKELGLEEYLNKVVPTELVEHFYTSQRG